MLVPPERLSENSVMNVAERMGAEGVGLKLGVRVGAGGAGELLLNLAFIPQPHPFCCKVEL